MNGVREAKAVGLKKIREAIVEDYRSELLSRVMVIFASRSVVGIHCSVPYVT